MIAHDPHLLPGDVFHKEMELNNYIRIELDVNGIKWRECENVFDRLR